MKHIKDLLNKRIKQSGLSQNIETALIINEFTDLLKKYIKNINSSKIKPLYIKNQILTVACLNSVLVQELSFIKSSIISDINKKFKSQVIKDIKFLI